MRTAVACRRTHGIRKLHDRDCIHRPRYAVQVAEIHPPRLWGTPPISRLPRCARARRYQYQVWDIWNGIYAHERGHSWKINAQLKA